MSEPQHKRICQHSQIWHWREQSFEKEVTQVEGIPKEKSVISGEKNETQEQRKIRKRWRFICQRLSTTYKGQEPEILETISTFISQVSQWLSMLLKTLKKKST